MGAMYFQNISTLHMCDKGIKIEISNYIPYTM